jgi:uncharacterized Ntn-hydrolase superfamily protein
MLNEPINQPHCATYSMILRDPGTGCLGSAVASKYLAVGGAVVHSQAGVGIVHGQFNCCHDTANRILTKMADSMVPEIALEEALALDPLPHKRQILVMEMQGRTAVHTGAAATPAHAQHARQDLVAAGNTLASVAVIKVMIESFAATGSKPLLLRLILALEAAEQCGGDHRGKQSAAVRILQPMDRPWSDNILDFRVDDHPDPICELHRLFEVSQRK